MSLGIKQTNPGAGTIEEALSEMAKAELANICTLITLTNDSRPAGTSSTPRPHRDQVQTWRGAMLSVVTGVR